MHLDISGFFSAKSSDLINNHKMQKDMSFDECDTEELLKQIQY